MCGGGVTEGRIESLSEKTCRVGENLARTTIWQLGESQ